MGFDDPTWEPASTMKKDDPVTLAKYADEKGLIKEGSKWWWARKYVKRDVRFSRMMRNVNQAKARKGPKYQFGVQVPRNVKEAYQLDEANGNTLWTSAIQKEITSLHDEFECFRV